MDIKKVILSTEMDSFHVMHYFVLLQPPTPCLDSTHLLSAVLVLSAQVHALAPVSFALFVVGFLGIGVVPLAVAKPSNRARKPLL